MGTHRRRERQPRLRSQGAGLAGGCCSTWPAWFVNAAVALYAMGIACLRSQPRYAAFCRLRRIAERRVRPGVAPPLARQLWRRGRSLEAVLRRGPRGAVWGRRTGSRSDVPRSRRPRSAGVPGAARNGSTRRSDPAFGRGRTVPTCAPRRPMISGQARRLRGRARADSESIAGCTPSRSTCARDRAARQGTLKEPAQAMFDVAEPRHRQGPSSSISATSRSGTGVAGWALGRMPQRTAARTEYYMPTYP